MCFDDDAAEKSGSLPSLSAPPFPVRAVEEAVTGSTWLYVGVSECVKEPCDGAGGWSGSRGHSTARVHRDTGRWGTPALTAAGGVELHLLLGRMVTRVYTASSSCSTTMKKHQQEVMQYLEAHNIDFEVVDITMSEEKRQWMYKNIPKSKWPEHGNPLPPQIYYGDTYCGDYNDFFEAKESNTVSSFLRIKSKSASRKEEM